MNDYLEDSIVEESIGRKKRKCYIASFLLGASLTGSILYGFSKNILSWDPDTKQITFSMDRFRDTFSIFPSKVLQWGLSCNFHLTEEEKEACLDLSTYVDENPYLSYWDIFSTFSSLEMTDDYQNLQVYPGSSFFVSARYDASDNEIIFYHNDTKSLSLGHELIHATGGLPFSFLNEGMVSLLTAEYLSNGEVLSYSKEVCFVEILLSFVDADTLLEAYTKEDISILLEALEEFGMQQEDAVSLFQEIDEYCALYKSFDVSRNALDASLETIFPYIDFLSQQTNEATVEKVQTYWDLLSHGELSFLIEYHYSKEEMQEMAQAKVKVK